MKIIFSLFLIFLIHGSAFGGYENDISLGLPPFRPAKKIGGNVLSLEPRGVSHQRSKLFHRGSVARRRSLSLSMESRQRSSVRPKVVSSHVVPFLVLKSTSVKIQVKDGILTDGEGKPLLLEGGVAVKHKRRFMPSHFVAFTDKGLQDILSKSLNEIEISHVTYELWKRIDARLTTAQEASAKDLFISMMAVMRDRIVNESSHSLFFLISYIKKNNYFINYLDKNIDNFISKSIFTIPELFFILNTVHTFEIIPTDHLKEAVLDYFHFYRLQAQNPEEERSLIPDRLIDIIKIFPYIEISWAKELLLLWYDMFVAVEEDFDFAQTISILNIVNLVDDKPNPRFMRKVLNALNPDLNSALTQFSDVDFLHSLDLVRKYYLSEDYWKSYDQIRRFFNDWMFYVKIKIQQGGFSQNQLIKIPTLLSGLPDVVIEPSFVELWYRAILFSIPDGPSFKLWNLVDEMHGSYQDTGIDPVFLVHFSNLMKSHFSFSSLKEWKERIVFSEMMRKLFQIKWIVKEPLEDSPVYVVFNDISRDIFALIKVMPGQHDWFSRFLSPTLDKFYSSFRRELENSIMVDDSVCSLDSDYLEDFLVFLDEITKKLDCPGRFCRIDFSEIINTIFEFEYKAIRRRKIDKEFVLAALVASSKDFFELIISKHHDDHFMDSFFLPLLMNLSFIRNEELKMKFVFGMIEVIISLNQKSEGDLVRDLGRRVFLPDFPPELKEIAYQLLGRLIYEKYIGDFNDFIEGPQRGFFIAHFVSQFIREFNADIDSDLRAYYYDVFLKALSFFNQKSENLFLADWEREIKSTSFPKELLISANEIVGYLKKENEDRLRAYSNIQSEIDDF